jgi:hypothetical protein
MCAPADGGDAVSNGTVNTQVKSFATPADANLPGLSVSATLLTEGEKSNKIKEKERGRCHAL